MGTQTQRSFQKNQKIAQLPKELICTSNHVPHRPLLLNLDNLIHHQRRPVWKTPIQYRWINLCLRQLFGCLTYIDTNRQVSSICSTVLPQYCRKAPLSHSKNSNNRHYNYHCQPGMIRCPHNWAHFHPPLPYWAYSLQLSSPMNHRSPHWSIVSLLSCHNCSQRDHLLGEY